MTEKGPKTLIKDKDTLLRSNSRQVQCRSTPLECVLRHFSFIAAALFLFQVIRKTQSLFSHKNISKQRSIKMGFLNSKGSIDKVT